MDPLDFLPLAEQLAKRDEEAAHRTAASRSYYGAYLHLWSALSTIGIDAGKGSESHERVRQLLQTASQTKGIGRKFSRLQSRRIDADYKMEMRFLKDTAIAAYRQARNIETEFARLDINRLKAELTRS